jgi:two-component sensor histidine kinase
MPLNENEKARLREALHKMNNALNSISMQAELSKMYLEQNKNELVEEALGIIMSQCRQCSAITQSTHGLLQDE